MSASLVMSWAPNSYLARVWKKGNILIWTVKWNGWFGPLRNWLDLKEISRNSRRWKWALEQVVTQVAFETNYCHLCLRFHFAAGTIRAAAESPFIWKCAQLHSKKIISWPSSRSMWCRDLSFREKAVAGCREEEYYKQSTAITTGHIKVLLRGWSWTQLPYCCQQNKQEQFGQRMREENYFPDSLLVPVPVQSFYFHVIFAVNRAQSFCIPKRTFCLQVEIFIDS